MKQFPLRFAHDNIRRTNTVDWSNAYFVKIWPQFSKEKLSCLKTEFAARDLSGPLPGIERYRAPRHMLEPDVRCLGYYFTGINGSDKASGYVAYCQPDARFL